MMEILIIATMPIAIGMMVAVHAWASAESKVFSGLDSVYCPCSAGSPVASISSF
jgi:hypothetical protein